MEFLTKWPGSVHVESLYQMGACTWSPFTRWEYECAHGVPLPNGSVHMESLYQMHCKKRAVTEHPRGAIFYCFRGNSMDYHGNSKILLPWGVPIHRVFYSVGVCTWSPFTKCHWKLYLTSFQ